MEDLIEIKIDIVEYIDNLNISEDNKIGLKYWVEKKQQDQDQKCDDFISGMCLALQNEKKITPEDFMTIVMWEGEKRKEESWWKTFLKSIGF